MTARPAGRKVACSPSDARARLRDAEAFLEVTDIATHADVVATNAIHAAIAAADAICCLPLRERSADGSHVVAVRMLAQVDRALANSLARCLDRKTQAAYESRDVSARDAAGCVRHAAALVEAARERLLRA